MSKQKKLLIMFICTLISTLVIPIFTQWYEEQTGIWPGGFYAVLVFGGIISYLTVATNNFKDLR
jgi:hypothetical protein